MKFDKDAVLAGLVTYRTIRDFLRRRVDEKFTANRLGRFLDEQAGDDAERRFHQNWRWKNHTLPRIMKKPQASLDDEMAAWRVWQERRNAKYRSQARKIIAAMVEAGLVEIVDESRTSYLYSEERPRDPPKIKVNRRKAAKLTQLGIQLRATSWSPRLNRSKVERRLHQFLERVRYVNEHPEEFLREVPIVGVFGSVLDPGSADYGDIDIVCDMSLTSRLWNDPDGRRTRIINLFKQDHPDWADRPDLVWYLDPEDPNRIYQNMSICYYPDRKTRRFLKKGDGYLSLHSVDENLKTTVKMYVEGKAFLPEPRLQDWPSRKEN